MIRRLILLRHAKSDWSSDGLGDHERPLNARGRKSAPQVGRTLTARGWVPEAVRSSDSARTRETWGRAAPELPATLEPEWVPALYLASARTILEVAAQVPDEVRCALLLGHNPGMSDAATRLAGTYVELRTADAALLEAEGPTWAVALDPTVWRLVDVIRARDEG